MLSILTVMVNHEYQFFEHFHVQIQMTDLSPCCQVYHN